MAWLERSSQFLPGTCGSTWVGARIDAATRGQPRLRGPRACVAHLGWPGAAQVCRTGRTREKAGRISRDIAYAVTSRTPEQADPDALLAFGAHTASSRTACSGDAA